MGLKVRSEVAPVGEGPLAVLAVEGLLAGVRPDVPLEEPRSGEGLSAKVTLAGQRVRADVHLECAQADVDLLAVLAGEGLLCLAFGRGAVELLVLREAGVGGVGLSAVGAGVAGR